VLGSLFYSGFAPRLRGTCGTLVTAAAMAAWVYLASPPFWALYLTAGSLCVMSLVVSEWAIKAGLLKGDPDWFVLDEAAGFALLVSLLGKTGPWDFCFAFVVFRFYDIAKPWPASSFELLPRGVGILFDDLAAAVLGAWTIWTVSLAATGLFLA